MAMIMPEVAVQRLLQYGIRELRNKPEQFQEVFSYFLEEELAENYGQQYIDQIRTWFMSTKLPVVQAFAFDPETRPQISIHLGIENEDESKAAMDDLYGMGDEADIKIINDTVVVDIGLHADKAKDYVLWMFYIIKWILFKRKRMAERLGLRLHTYSVSDYNKDAQYMAENMWTRWIRFRCVASSSICDDAYEGPYDVDVDVMGQPAGSEDDDDIVDI